MDPLEFRLKNLKDERFRAVLEAAAERFGWADTQGRAQARLRHRGGLREGRLRGHLRRGGGGPRHRNLQGPAVVDAFECGAVVNPDHLRNQIEGAIVMGLGGALFEAIEFEDGKILNPRLSRYRVPRFTDVPPIETVLLDRKDLPPAGAGETPIVGIAPAIGNAIFDATGVRLRSLPLDLRPLNVG